MQIAFAGRFQFPERSTSGQKKTAADLICGRRPYEWRRQLFFACDAFSVTTRTALPATCRNAPATSNDLAPAPEPTGQGPLLSSVIIGALPVTMPTSPSKAGATTLSA